jgi:hypothetical protein
MEVDRLPRPDKDERYGAVVVAGSRVDLMGHGCVTDASRR